MATRTDLERKLDAVKREYGSNHGRRIIKELTPSEDEYQPPCFPIDLPKFTEKVKFGAEMKAKHFFVKKEWTFINHGQFGACLREAAEAQHMWMTHMEEQSARFFDRNYFEYFTYAVRRVAKFLDAERDEIVFIRNATVGNTTVIQHVAKTLNPGDSILTLSVAYGIVLKLLRQISQETKIRVDEVKVEFPIKSKDYLIKLVEDSIKADTKFAVLDHVSSAYCITLPIKELVEVCHKRGVQVLVDGAHCFGSLPLSMKDIGADYYVTNGHKWFLTPKGCAVMYVSKARQSIIRPLVLSWGHDLGFNSEFAYGGTDDYTQWLSIHTVLDFWEFYGPETIRKYLCGITKEAEECLVREWGTDLLADPSLFDTMSLVRLPDGLVGEGASEVLNRDEDGRPLYDYCHAGFVGDKLHHDYKIEIPVKAVSGRLYVRVALHVYNEMSEVQRLADAVNEIKKMNSSAQ